MEGKRGRFASPLDPPPSFPLTTRPWPWAKTTIPPPLFFSLFPPPGPVLPVHFCGGQVKAENSYTVHPIAKSYGNNACVLGNGFLNSASQTHREEQKNAFPSTPLLRIAPPTFFLLSPFVVSLSSLSSRRLLKNSSLSSSPFHILIRAIFFQPLVHRQTPSPPRFKGLLFPSLPASAPPL